MAFSFADLAESGRPRVNQKVLAVTSLWLSVTLSVGIAASLSTQRGLSDVSEAPTPPGFSSVVRSVSSRPLLPGFSFREPTARPRMRSRSSR